MSSKIYVLKMRSSDCGGTRKWKSLNDGVRRIIRLEDVFAGWRGSVGGQDGFRVTSIMDFMNLDEEFLTNYVPNFSDSSFFAERFIVLNDREEIIKALVEARVLHKDAIEAFANDVPPRVQEPIRDNHLDACEVRWSGGDTSPGAYGSTRIAPPSVDHSGYDEYRRYLEERIRGDRNQRGNGIGYP